MPDDSELGWVEKVQRLEEAGRERPAEERAPRGAGQMLASPPMRMLALALTWILMPTMVPALRLLTS